ncbi:MAG: hypothetical protein U5L45_09635 [Saprospiraceae bacterium]|nr:hypothetical protein [Saprospiraceae bacterium]
MEKNVTDKANNQTNNRVDNQIDAHETAALIVRYFELTTPDKDMTEAELLAYLADVIAYMIDKKLDYLLSLLYRLDVSERKINRALMPGNVEDAHVALARLVIERQKQRIATKRAYREQHPTNWNWDLE